MVIRHLFDEFFVCKVRGRDGFTQGGESVALVIRHKILRGSVHICAEDEVDKTDHHALQVDGLAHPSIEVLEPCWVDGRIPFACLQCSKDGVGCGGVHFVAYGHQKLHFVDAVRSREIGEAEVAQRTADGRLQGCEYAFCENLRLMMWVDAVAYECAVRLLVYVVSVALLQWCGCGAFEVDELEHGMQRRAGLPPRNKVRQWQRLV